MAFELPAIAPRDRFTVLGEIGRGSFGVVYRATDRDLGGDVAVKRLLHHTPADLGQLKDEFRILSSVRHPNLAALHELFSDGRDAFFTMSLVDGIPLDEAVHGSGAASLETRVARLSSMVPSLASGLGALHAHHLLHGDIKPSNALVNASHGVTLLDFGFARSVDVKQPNHRFSGTLAYIPPEVYQGHEAGLAADLYSVGVMLFEALAGAQPFDTEATAFYADKIAGRHKLLNEVVPDAPEWIIDLVHRLLDVDPSRRPDVFQLASSFGADVTSYEPFAGVPFVGRAVELEAVRDALEERGRPTAIMVHGPSGIGKSTFIRQASSNARRAGARAVSGACSFRELVPFGAFDAVVDDLVRQVSANSELRAVLDRENIGTAMRLFPSLARLTDAWEEPVASVTVPQLEERSTAIAALRALLCEIAHRGPLVVAIDDYQWASPDCLALLEALVAGDGAPCILWLLAVRDEPDGVTKAPVPPAPSAHDIALGPLSQEEQARLWRQATGRPAAEVPASLSDESAGSPFFLLELARARDASGSLEARLKERLGRLGAARMAVELVSLAASPLPRRAVLQAAELDGNRWPLLYELESQGWIRSDRSSPARYVLPYHDRIAQLVKADLDDDATRGLHGRLYTALQRHEGASAAQLYTHALGCDRAIDARGHAVDAGDEARALLAYADAGEWYERADALGDGKPDRADLTQRAAEVFRLAGYSRKASLLYEAAAERLSGSTSLIDGRVVALRIAAAHSAIHSGDNRRGLSLMQPLFPLFGDALPSSDAAAMREGMWQRAKLLWRWQPRAVVQRAEDPKMRDYLDLLYSASACLSATRFMVADCLALRHLHTALRTGDRRHLCRGLTYEGMVEASLGGRMFVARAEAMLDRAEALADDDLETRGYLKIARASAAWSQGKWAECTALAHAAEEIFRDEGRGLGFEVGVFRLYDYSARWWLGDIQYLRERVPASLVDARARRDRFAEITFLVGEPSGVLVAEDKADEVVRTAEALRWRGSEPNTQRFQRLSGLVRAYLYLDEPELAWREIEAEWPAMKKGLYPTMAMTGSILWLARGRTAGALALAAARRADRRGLQRWTREARACAGKLRKKATNVMREPMAAAVEASALAAEGKHHAARKLLRAAATDFERGGMLLHAACARLASGDGAAAARLRDLGVAHPEAFARAMI